MLPRLLLAAAGGGSFSVPPAAFGADRLMVYNGSIDGGSTYAIGAAQSHNGGVSFSKSGSNPILQKTGSGWERDGVKDPWIVWDGTQYVLFYSGYKTTSGDAKFQIGRATAATWADVMAGNLTREATNPVIANGGSGSIDESDAQAACVLYDPTAANGHKWWMWYTATNAAQSITSGLAYSDNGISWTKVGAAPSGAGGAVVYRGGVYYMLYAIAGVNLVTFTNPNGTYTIDSHNPYIAGSKSAFGNSAVLSANVSAGATSLPIVAGTLSAINVGEPLFVVDGVTGPEITIARSVGSTSVGVDALTFGYTTAHGATARSFLYTIHGPRSFILHDDGSVEAYGTPFRPGDGLTFSGNALWEGSIRYTAPSWTGAWAVDWTASLLLPLTQLGNAWDSVSAENPCVILP